MFPKRRLDCSLDRWTGGVGHAAVLAAVLAASVPVTPSSAWKGFLVPSADESGSGRLFHNKGNTWIQMANRLTGLEMLDTGRRSIEAEAG